MPGPRLKYNTLVHSFKRNPARHKTRDILVHVNLIAPKRWKSISTFRSWVRGLIVSESFHHQVQLQEVGFRHVKKGSLHFHNSREDRHQSPKRHIHLSRSLGRITVLLVVNRDVVEVRADSRQNDLKQEGKNPVSR